MADKSDAPHVQMQVEFEREGNVTFLLTKIQTALLRGLINSDLRMSAIRQKIGLKNAFLRNYLLISAITISIILSIYSYKTMSIFDFFAVNKHKIGKINKEEMQNGKIALTFLQGGKAQ